MFNFLIAYQINFLPVSYNPLWRNKYRPCKLKYFVRYDNHHIYVLCNFHVCLRYKLNLLSPCIGFNLRVMQVIKDLLSLLSHQQPATVQIDTVQLRYGVFCFENNSKML